MRKLIFKSKVKRFFKRLKWKIDSFSVFNFLPERCVVCGKNIWAWQRAGMDVRVVDADGCFVLEFAHEKCLGVISVVGMNANGMNDQLRQ